jgi:hypothetical protein
MKSFPLALLPALLLLAPAARAESGVHVSADFNLGSLISSGALTVGGGGRVGYRADLGPVWLQPEAAGDYMAFTLVGCDACKVGGHGARVMGGLRLGGSGLISGVIEPALFGHGGYGWVTPTSKGPAFDVGFGFDVKAVRYFRFGAHGAYNVVSGTGADGGLYQPTPVSAAAKWISFGLHAGAAF